MWSHGEDGMGGLARTQHVCTFTHTHTYTHIHTHTHSRFALILSSSTTTTSSSSSSSSSACVCLYVCLCVRIYQTAAQSLECWSYLFRRLAESPWISVIPVRVGREYRSLVFSVIPVRGNGIPVQPTCRSWTGIPVGIPGIPMDL